MVRAVRAGMSTREAAARFGLSKSVVGFWAARASTQRLDRVDFRNHKPGRAWNRTGMDVERHIVRLRTELRDTSVLGEYGAAAIRRALQAQGQRRVPSEATINRVLSRHGLQDAVRRVRRPPPPKGWYLPAVAAGEAELDCFDFVEELKIAQGPLVDIFTAKSLHGGLTEAMVLTRKSTSRTLICLRKRWQRDGLPTYAQFDNDTVFQGAHQFANTVGRISRLCLQLGVIPVFVPPMEHGMQNIIESFNALWQAKVWRRHHVRSARQLQQRSDDYVRAYRARLATTRDIAPARRPMPKRFKFNLRAPLQGTLIYIRRTNERGQVHMLGQQFTVSPTWPHHLVRCEVDFTHQSIRCFALRRRIPNDQPLLATIPYAPPQKPFQGAS